MDTGHLIEDPFTTQVMDLLNGLYEVTLQALSRHFVHHGEMAVELGTLARTTKQPMNWVMRTLGPTLATLPISTPSPNSTAGSPSTSPVQQVFFLPHRDSAWRIIEERLLILAERCDPFNIASHLDTFDDLTAKVRAMAGELRAHLEERASSTGTNGSQHC